jgi:hypothetical protein
MKYLFAWGLDVPRIQYPDKREEDHWPCRGVGDTRPLYEHRAEPRLIEREKRRKRQDHVV